MPSIKQCLEYLSGKGASWGSPESKDEAAEPTKPKIPLHARYKRNLGHLNGAAQKLRRKSLTLQGLHLHVCAYKLMAADLANRLGMSEEEKLALYERHVRVALNKMETNGYIVPTEVIPNWKIRQERGSLETTPAPTYLTRTSDGANKAD